MSYPVLGVVVAHDAAPVSEPLVAIRDLGLTYPVAPRWLRAFIRTSTPEPVTALRSVDLVVNPGDLVGIIGANGAGKTTLFRVLLGLVAPTVGEVRVLGADVADDSVAIRRRLGYLPSDVGSLFLRYTCVENLAFHGRLHGMHGSGLRSAITENLELVGLDHVRDRVAVALSTGMRYRLMLARALMHDPSLLILDEPTGPLDPVAAQRFVELIQGIVRERLIGALVSSHRLDDIEAMPDRVILLDEGRIVHDGSVAALRSLVSERVLELQFVSSAAARRARAALTVSFPDVSLGGAETVVTVPTTGPVGAVLAGLGDPGSIVHLDVHRPALREVVGQVLGARGGVR